MPFYQTAPELGNQYAADDVLQRYLRNTLPADMLSRIEPELSEIGELAGGDLCRAVDRAASRRAAPRPVGRVGASRQSHRALSAVEARRAHHRREGAGRNRLRAEGRRALPRAPVRERLRPRQPSHVYSCPLAMTDGAARTLLAAKNQALIDRAVPRLTSRDPDQMWTSGQWMTERTGGSDVAISETVAQAERRRVAALRDEVVHLGDDVADGAHARAARGQSARRQRPRAVLPRDPQADGSMNAHPGQPPQGQARHAQGPDRGAHARRDAADPRDGPRPEASEHHADAQHHADVERGRRGRRHAPRPRARAGLRETSQGVRRAARRQAAAHRHAGGARSGVRGRVPPRVPSASSSSARTKRASSASTRPRCSGCSRRS